MAEYDLSQAQPIAPPQYDLSQAQLIDTPPSKPGVISEALKGVGRGFGALARVPAVTAYGGANLIGGEESAAFAQKYYIDPLDRLRETLAPAPEEQQNLATRVAGGVGEFLPSLALGGLVNKGLGALPEAATLADKIVRGLAVGGAAFGLPQAVNQATDAVRAGDDVATSFAAGGVGGALGTVMGIVPASVPGNLLTRAATGAAAQVGLGEAQREITNTVFSEHPDQQTPFTGAGAATNAVIGALMGGVLGPRAGAKPEAKPTELPPAETPPAEAPPAAPTKPPASAADLLSYATARLDELNQKAKGVPEQQVTGEDGTLQTIPTVQPEYLTEAEKAERAFLTQSGSDAAAVAGQYGLRLEEPPAPEATHADLAEQHAAATQQVADLTPALAQTQQAHDDLIARRDALTAEAKLPLGERRTKSDILTEKKAVAAQIKDAKAKLEEVGGQLNSAKKSVETLMPQVEAAKQALTSEAPPTEVTPAMHEQLSLRGFEPEHIAQLAPEQAAEAIRTTPTVEEAVARARVAAGEAPATPTVDPAVAAQKTTEIRGLLDQTKKLGVDPKLTDADIHQLILDKGVDAADKTIKSLNDIIAGRTGPKLPKDYAQRVAAQLGERAKEAPAKDITHTGGNTVEMSPQKYLELAAPFGHQGGPEADAAKVAKLAALPEWETKPMLSVKAGENGLQVGLHDGRHRALAAIARGDKTIPVEIVRGKAFARENPGVTDADIAARIANEGLHSEYTSPPSTLQQLHDHIDATIGAKKLSDEKKTQYASDVKSAIEAITTEARTTPENYRSTFIKDEVAKRVGLRVNAEIKSDIVDHIEQASKEAAPAGVAQKAVFMDTVDEEAINKKYPKLVRDVNDALRETGYRGVSVEIAEHLKASNKNVTASKKASGHTGIGKVAGGFDTNQNTIILSAKVLSKLSKADIVEFIAHEAEHAKQHAAGDSRPLLEREVDAYRVGREARANIPDTLKNSRAGLTQEEFERLPPRSQAAASDAYGAAMANRGHAMLARLAQLVGDRPDLDVKLFTAGPGDPIGSYARVSEYKSVISMALNAKSAPGVADHEGYHYAEDRLLTAAERRITANALTEGKPLFDQLVTKLRQYDRENQTDLVGEVTSNPAEARAYAFEFWRRGDLDVMGHLARAWQKLQQFFEKVSNAVQGLGFQSAEDVFTALDHGEMATRGTNIGGDMTLQRSRALAIAGRGKSFADLAQASDEVQTRIDAREAQLDKDGVSWEDQKKDAVLNALYEERIAHDTAAAQKGYNGAKAIMEQTLSGMPHSTGFASIDSMLRERYSLTDKPNTGVYMMSKYTGKAIDDPKTVLNLARDITHLIVARDYPSADFHLLMESNMSALTGVGKSKILAEAQAKAEQVNDGLRQFFTSGDTFFSQAAKEVEEFNRSPADAGKVVDRTASFLAQAADRIGTGNAWTKLNTEAFRHLAQWKTVQYLNHQADVHPELKQAGVADGLREYREAHTRETTAGTYAMEAPNKVIAAAQKVFRTLGDEVKVRALNRDMQEIGVGSSMNGTDFVRSGAANRIADQTLTPRQVQRADAFHQQYQALQRSHPEAAQTLLTGALAHRQQLVFDVAHIARELLNKTTDPAAQLVKNMHATGLDMMAKDVREARNGDTTRFYDGASFTLDRRLQAAFKAAAGLQKDSLLREQMNELRDLYYQQVRSPYFSAGRQGDYFANVGFREMDDATWARMNAAIQSHGIILGDHQGQDHIFVRTETPEEAAALRRKLTDAAGNKVDLEQNANGPLAQAPQISNVKGLSKAMRSILDTIQEALPNNAEAQNVRDALMRKVMSMIPETASRSAAQLRRNVPGYDADFLGAFGRRAQGGAQDTARIYAAPLFTQAFKTMDQSMVNLNKGGSEDAKARGGIISDELRTRYNNLMKPSDNSTVNTINSISHAFYLGGATAFYIRTMAQPFHRGLPILGSRYGFYDSAKEILHGQADALKVIAASVKQAVGENGIKGALDADFRFKDMGFTPKEEAFLQELHDRGILKLGQARQMADLALTGVQHGQDAIRALSMTAGYAEMTNRLATGIAAFRLAEKGKAGLSQQGTKANTEYAVKTIVNAMDDFDQYNTARAIGRNGIAGKVTPLLTQFMNYSLQTMQQIARTVQDGVFNKDQSPEGLQRSAEAKKEFAGLMATTAMISGGLGLPFANAIAGVYNQLTKDEDDPSDIRLAARNALADALGTKGGEIAAHGLGGVLGVDTASFGLQNLLPGSEFLASRRLMKDRLDESSAQLMGPALNVGMDLALGLSKMSDGYYVKGIEQMLPSALKGYWKAGELATRGYTDSKGNPIALKPNGWDIGVQALGLRPQDKAEQAEAANYFGTDQYLLQHRKAVLEDQVYKAVTHGTAEDQQAAFAAATKFSRQNPLDAIRDWRGMFRAHALSLATAASSETGVGVSSPRLYPKLGTKLRAFDTATQP